jgi:DNA-directed RNA polymerase specialized sigma24 family protein
MKSMNLTADPFVTVATTSTIPTTARPRDPAELLMDPGVVRATKTTLLRHGVRLHELDDAFCEVRIQALHATRKRRPSPATIGEWKALCCRIAVRMCIRRKKVAKQWEKYDAGLCEEPDEQEPIARSPGKARHPVEVARYLAVLKGQFEAGDMPEHGALILERTADGVSTREIAKELDLPKTTVEERLKRMRRLFKKKCAALGLTVTSMVLWVLLAAPFGGGGVSHPAPDARDVRVEALRACEAEQWDTCVKGLDEAKELDPAGDEDPEVQAARERASHATSPR